MVANKTTTAPRPDSYAATAFSAKHLGILYNNISEFIDIMRPSFDAASRKIAGTRYSKAGVTLYGGYTEKYQSPSELLGWLSKKVDNILDLQGRIEQVRNSNISGKDLDNLRQVRAFFIRFKSIANREYGGDGNFSFRERSLQQLLHQDISTESENGGVFDILRNILRDEKAFSTKDLSTINDKIDFGKTLKAVVVQRHKDFKSLKNDATPPDRSSATPSSAPEAAAATRNPSMEQELLF